ncbi:hypothetical protein AVT_27745 (plasmid) [Bacillus tropicus]|uniref:hypothetical protein n=1 Tax=Bacillus TaxID=1386 RepID=UPI0013F1EB71|nr:MULTISPECIES: hypothetical protein [Bacillus]WBO93070.1 hypothetical protein AVT_27745 [Bacillus tropicus]
MNQQWISFNGKTYRIPKDEVELEKNGTCKKLKLDCLIGYAHDTVKRIDIFDGGGVI